MTDPFFDTGVALKLVVEEPLSPTVRDYVSKRRVAVPFTRLMEVEVENALQALAFRNDITRTQLAAARRLVRSLVRKGRFRRIHLSLDKVAAETLSLAPAITSKTGCRTLDLMHVATAKLLGSGEFISTDKRQIEAAKLCGLSAINLESNRA